jgi:hypothetical protein
MADIEKQQAAGETAAPQKKKSSSNTLLIVVLSVLAIAFGVTAFKVWQNRDKLAIFGGTPDAKEEGEREEPFTQTELTDGEEEEGKDVEHDQPEGDGQPDLDFGQQTPTGKDGKAPAAKEEEFTFVDFGPKELVGRTAKGTSFISQIGGFLAGAAKDPSALMRTAGPLLMFLPMIKPIFSMIPWAGLGLAACAIGLFLVVEMIMTEGEGRSFFEKLKNSIKEKPGYVLMGVACLTLGLYAGGTLAMPYVMPLLEVLLSKIQTTSLFARAKQTFA